MFNRVMLVIAGILMILCGFLMINNPVINLYALSTFISILIILNGIFSIVAYMKSEKDITNPWWMCVDGIISLLIGLWLVLSKLGLLTLTFAIPILLTIWIIIAGIIRIISSFQFKKLGVTKWWLGFTIGIISLIVGVLLIRNYTMAFALTSALMVITFFVKGISDIVLGITLKSK